MNIDRLNNKANFWDRKMKPTKVKNCLHEKTERVYEDNILLGEITYGVICSICSKFIGDKPSVVELGIYK